MRVKKRAYRTGVAALLAVGSLLGSQVPTAYASTAASVAGQDARMAAAAPDEPRDCNDGNPYTTDTYDAALGYCTHVFPADVDLDNDGVKASEVGGVDCDDDNSAVRPGVADIAGNGVDENCDGRTDGVGPRNCDDGNGYTVDKYSNKKGYCLHTLQTTADLDGDGWVAAEVAGGDCNDTDAAAHPHATEVDNGVDDDCDGIVDSGDPSPPVGETGTVTPTSYQAPPSCPAGQVCESYLVECGGLPATTATVSRADASGVARGVVVLLSGGEGQNFLIGGKDGTKTVADLQNAGLVVLQVAWPATWVKLAAAPYGLDSAACRSATIVKFLHDEEFVPLGLPDELGVCGFCIGGNSAGATQDAYALSDYGLDDIIDGAVMTGGPILAALAEGCLDLDIGYDVSLTDSSRIYADYAYGHLTGEDGPCMNRDESMKAIWDEDSILNGGSDYLHPGTRLVFQIGGQDAGNGPGNAAAYADKLREAGSPMVYEELFPDAGHGIAKFLADPAAQAAFVSAFTEPSPS